MSRAAFLPGEGRRQGPMSSGRQEPVVPERVLFPAPLSSLG
ncbi:hypothetical protein ACI2L4_08415 [Streptomyces sparsogenes]